MYYERYTLVPRSSGFLLVELMLGLMVLSSGFTALAYICSTIIGQHAYSMRLCNALQGNYDKALCTHEAISFCSHDCNVPLIDVYGCKQESVPVTLNAVLAPLSLECTIISWKEHNGSNRTIARIACQ